MAESSPLRLFSADPGSSTKGWAVADCSFEDGPHVRMRQLSGLGLKTLVDDVCAAAQEHHVLLALDAPLRAFGGMQAPSSFESAGAAKGGRAWPFDVNPFSQRPCEHALSSKPTVVNDSLVARELAMAVGQLCGWDAECRMPGNLSFTSLHDDRIGDGIHVCAACADRADLPRRLGAGGGFEQCVRSDTTWSLRNVMSDASRCSSLTRRWRYLVRGAGSGWLPSADTHVQAVASAVHGLAAACGCGRNTPPACHGVVLQDSNRRMTSSTHSSGSWASGTGHGRRATSSARLATGASSCRAAKADAHMLRSGKRRPLHSRRSEGAEMADIVTAQRDMLGASPGGE